MTRAFTPGPWESVGGVVEAADNIGIAEVRAYGWIPRAGGVEEHRLPEDANARLIAAAPELYEALRDLADSHHCYPDARSCSLDRFVRAARTALAKADGR